MSQFFDMEKEMITRNEIVFGITSPISRKVMQGRVRLPANEVKWDGLQNGKIFPALFIDYQYVDG
jgi:hypothetical protein